MRMDPNLELAELKKDGVGKAISLLRLQWNDLHSHLDSSQYYLEERFTQLQSRHKCLLSIQESVAGSNKHLDSIRQSLEERAKEIEHKHHEFLVFQEQHFNELKLKEKQLDLMRKSVEERIKEMELREEKLVAHQRSIEEFFEKLDLEMKQFQNIQKSSGERLEEINRKEMQLESKEALLQSARKCIKDVLESCSNGKKRKHQSEGESKKKHKISGSCLQEQVESMTATEKMSTPEKANFESETIQLRRKSPREFQTIPRPGHSNGAKEGKQVDFTYSKENASSCLANDEKTKGKVDSIPIKVAEEVFHDFMHERSWEKFKTGQIWAMYDEDGLPNRYVQIKHVQIKDITTYSYGLHVQHFEPLTTSQPQCCGIYKVQKGKEFYSQNPLSHMVKEQSISTMFFEIYPKKGQVWAINGNWNEDLSHSYLKKYCCKDIVEVLEDTSQSMKVSALVRVSGFKSVFRAARFSNAFVIPRVELSRFSHQIPAFLLTGENEGKLRGYWELDPAAVPGYI